MRKLLLIFVCALMACQLSGQSKSLMTHALSWSWDDEKGAWQELYQVLPQYDKEGKEIHTLTQDWNPTENTWINKAYCDNVITNGKKVTADCSIWNEDQSSWVKTYRIDYEYNKGGKKTEMLDRRWDEATQDWKLNRKDTYTYNQDNLLSEYEWFDWEEDTQSWVPNMRATYRYANGQQTAGVKQSFVDGEWVNKWQYLYQYNEDGLKTANEISHWNDKKSAWEKNSKWIYEHDEDNKVVNYKKQNWKNAWEDGQNTSYRYNSLGLLAEKLSGSWDIPSAEGYRETIRTQYLYKAAMATVNVTEQSAKDEQQLGVKELTAADLSNYPNPFKGQTTIRYELAKEAKVSIKVFDMAAKQVAELVNENKLAGVHTIEFDGSDLEAGIYTYQLNVEGQQSINRKMLVIR